MVSISRRYLPVGDLLAAPDTPVDGLGSHPLETRWAMIIVLMMVGILLLAAALRVVAIVWELLRPALGLLVILGVGVIVVIVAIMALSRGSDQIEGPAPFGTVNPGDARPTPQLKAVTPPPASSKAPGA